MTTCTVIFDLDNTLINRNAAFQVFSDRFVDQFIDYKDDDELRAAAIEFMRVADRNGYRSKWELFEEIRTSLAMKNRETTTEELMQYWKSFLDCTVLMDGALEVLDELKKKNCKLGMITNGSVYAQNSKIDKVNIRRYFDAIVVSDEVGVKKPDKQIFDIALSRLGVKPETCWFIGDNPLLDIEGARAAGINAIWMEGFMVWDNSIEEPKFKIKHLSELIHVVEGKFEFHRSSTS